MNEHKVWVYFLQTPTGKLVASVVREYDDLKEITDVEYEGLIGPFLVDLSKPYKP